MNAAETMLLPLLIGIGHSLEVDHLVAVSNLVDIRGEWTKQATKGATWGLGHTISVVLAAAGIGFLRMLFGPEQHWPFEILVGIMLLVIGLVKLRNALGKEFTHGDVPSKKVFFQVGLVHGLAGSGAVAALLSGHVSTTLDQCLFLAWFGIGTIVGMGAIAAVITRLQLFKHSFVHVYSILIASISVIYGLTILYQQTLKPFLS